MPTGSPITYDPSTALDTRTAKQLAKTLTSMVYETDWRYDGSLRGSLTLTPFHYGAIDVALGTVNKFERLLKARGLMRSIKNSNLVQLDPRVRLLVLTVFAQAFRSQLLDRGVIVHPLTDSSRLANNMEIYLDGAQRLWSYDDFMSPSQLSTDLLDVGADLSNVPLDDVLSFRQENRAHYISYATSLRQFLVTQATLSPAERRKAREERRREIQEQAAELRKISRSAFGIRSAALLFSLVGAAWT